MKSRILVIEPSQNFAQFLEYALQQEGYEVRVFWNSVEALEQCQNWEPHLVISEIETTPKPGFEILSEFAKLYPKCHRVLLTDQDIEEWIEELHTHGITNAYTKGLPFHTHEFLLRIRQLLSRDLFGLEPYFPSRDEYKVWKLRKPSDIEDVSQYLVGHCVPPLNSNHIRMVIIETLTNAMFYGARDEQGANKLDWDRHFELPEELAITLEYASDVDKIGFAVRDSGGKLDSQTVLYWLKRQICKDENGLPQGIFDHHGRGLFLTRKLMDRLYINVEKGRRSECVLLYYRESAPTKYKPISIAEIEPN